MRECRARALPCRSAGWMRCTDAARSDRAGAGRLRGFAVGPAENVSGGGSGFLLIANHALGPAQLNKKGDQSPLGKCDWYGNGLRNIARQPF